MNKLLRVFLVLSVWSSAFAEEGKPQMGLRIDLPEAQKDPAAFIRNHRVILARGFHREKEAEDSWVGMVGNPLFNDRPIELGSLFMLPVEILKSPELDKWEESKDHEYDLLLAEHPKKKGKLKVIGSLALRPENPEVSWIPVPRGGSLFDNQKLRYAKLIPDALEGLASTDTERKVGAIQLVGALGKEAAPHLPLVIGALSDKDEEVVMAAALALFQLGAPDAEAAVPKLIEALERKDIRYTVVQTLGRYGKEAKDAVPKIIEIMREVPGLTWEGICVKALSLIAPGDALVVDAVAPILKRGPEGLRADARVALGLKAEE